MQCPAECARALDDILKLLNLIQDTPCSLLLAGGGGYLTALRIPPGQIKATVFCGYVFLRNVLAQVLIWHLPEH